jgi:hypothetical protein
MVASDISARVSVRKSPRAVRVPYPVHVQLRKRNMRFCPYMSLKNFIVEYMILSRLRILTQLYSNIKLLYQSTVV